MRNQLILISALAFLLAAFSAGACESLLNNSSKRRVAAAFDVAPELNDSKIQYLLRANTMFVIRKSAGKAWTMLFDPRSETKNQAYYAYLEEVNGRMVVQGLRRAQNYEERDYFHKVAEMNQVNMTLIPLKKRLLNCQAIALDSWVSTKLWLKHKLKPEDVAFLLESGHTQPQLEHVHGNGDRNPRYKIEGRTAQGRRVRMVVVDEGGCPPPVVTAFEIARPQ
jgi:hypothetical protein